MTSIEQSIQPSPSHSRQALWGACLAALSWIPLAGLLALPLAQVLLVLAWFGQRSGFSFWRGRGLLCLGQLILVLAVAAQCLALSRLLPIVWTVRDMTTQQTRTALVQATHDDLDAISNALDDYAEDHGHYPPTQRPGHALPHLLTTPTAYLTALPRDPFGEPDDDGYRYVGNSDEFLLLGRGPDGAWEDVAPEVLLVAPPSERLRFLYTDGDTLDATGDIMLAGPQP